MTLDAQLVADVKAIAAAVKSALPAVGGTGKQVGVNGAELRTAR